MFDFFRKHQKDETPEFNSLKSFPYKDKYFYRVAQWDWPTQTEIHIWDPHGPRMITLDDWPQIVFLESDGQRTVAEYVNYMASLYKSKIPPGLDETIIYQLNSLTELRLIEYSDIKKKVDINFDKPYSSRKNNSSDTST